MVYGSYDQVAILGAKWHILTAVGYYGLMVYGSYDQVAIFGAKWHILELVGYFVLVVYGVYDYVPILGAMWHISRQLDTIMEMKAWRCNLTCSKSPAMQWRCMYDSVYAKRERKASCLKIPLTQLSFMVMLQQSWNILTACFWTESFPPPTQCCVIVATTHHILSWWPSLEIILATYHPTHSIRPLVQWWWKNWIDFGGNKIPTISSTSFFVTYKSGLITINVNDLCERRRGVT